MPELFALAPEPTAPDPDQNALFADMILPTAPAAPVYRVLARKYRPATFDDLIGQEAMVRTLSNAIETGRLPHAWMLTGVRGIGKTTTARIIARALNCTGVDGKGGPTIKPCGVCDSCRTIMEDRHVDVMEMDAASRTGVGDIREIIDGVRYGPVSARYKIYILDEVHMLSTAAFNALLKTLEEPPPHTKFIFATTEIRKVPITVLSRCQRFDLRRMDSDMLTGLFMKIAAKEDVTVEEDAIRLIARAADGSARDGLSLLDQAIARGNGAVTLDEVKDMLGLADRSHSLGLCRHLLRGEVKGALETYGLMLQAGSDPLQILRDSADIIHMLTRGQVISDYAQDKSLPEYDRQLLIELADIKIPALARSWQILLKGINEAQGAPNPAQAVEMVLIRLAYAAQLPPPADLIKQLKDAVAADGAGQGTPPSGGGGAKARLALGGGSVAAIHAMPAPESAPLVAVASYRELVALFDQNREAALYAMLYGSAHPVQCENGHLELRVTSDVPANFAGRVSQCLTQWTGQRWMVSISAQEGDKTLAELDRAAESARRERAMAHPLTQAVLKAFPEAKMTAIRQKAVAPIVVDAKEEVVSMTDDVVEMMELED